MCCNAIVSRHFVTKLLAKISVTRSVSVWIVWIIIYSYWINQNTFTQFSELTLSCKYNIKWFDSKLCIEFVFKFLNLPNILSGDIIFLRPVLSFISPLSSQNWQQSRFLTPSHHPFTASCLSLLCPYFFFLCSVWVQMQKRLNNG